MKANAILIYIEQNNTYYEISILCSNIFMYTTLDCDQIDNREQESGKAPSIHSMQSSCASLVPRTISYLYNCHDELQPCTYSPHFIVLKLFSLRIFPEIFLKYNDIQFQ